MIAPFTVDIAWNSVHSTILIEHVCVCVCVYVGMCVCLCLCVWKVKYYWIDHVSVCVWMCVCVSVSMDGCVDVCVWMSVSVCVWKVKYYYWIDHMSVCVTVSVYVCVKSKILLNRPCECVCVGINKRELVMSWDTVELNKGYNYWVLINFSTNFQIQRDQSLYGQCTGQ